MEKKKYTYLDSRRLKIPGVKTFFEKHKGMKDAKEHQLCELEDGHITPGISAKLNSYDSQMDKIYLKTAHEVEPMIREANAELVELRLLWNYKEPVMGGDSEEARRQAAFARAKAASAVERSAEILKRLAEIKAELDMVDEMLIHYTERAEGVLHASISKYWSGVLAASDENLEHFPTLDHKESPGRKMYFENRQTLIEVIDMAMCEGGGIKNAEMEKEEKK